MNYSTAIFLLSDEARGIMCEYEPGHKSHLFKTLNPNIKVDDLVIVPTSTRHEFTVVKVTEVDVEPDFEGNDEYDWIVDVVDLAGYQTIKEQEDTAIAHLRKSEKARKRRDLSENLAQFVGDEVKALPIYTQVEQES